MRIALIAALFSFSMVLSAAEPFVGTWKLDVARSTLLGNNKDVTSETMTISKVGPNTFRTTTDEMLKSGKTRHAENSRVMDGREHSATGVGLTPGLIEISEQVDASTRKITGKRDGKFLGEMTSTVSSDGKVMTNRWDTGQVKIFQKQ